MSQSLHVECISDSISSSQRISELSDSSESPGDIDDKCPKQCRHVDGCSSPTESTHGSTCISGQSCSTNNAHNYSTHCDRQLKVRSVSQRVQVERSSNSISSLQRISELPDSPESPGDIDDTMPKHCRHVDGCSSPAKSTHGSTCISGQSCSTNIAHNYSTCLLYTSDAADE